MNKKNSKNKNLPAIMVYSMRDIIFEKPEKPEIAAKQTITAIENSYNQCCFLDRRGVMWFNVERLDGILRTTKCIARHIVSEIPDSLKLFVASKIYVTGYEVGKLIDSRIQTTGLQSTREYLKYSESIYIAIRDCDSSFNIRASFALESKEKRKGLKSRRVRRYKIKYDELTNDILKYGAEFSHIRSYAIFSASANDVENGLIVNKQIHKEITAKNINDEDELLNLCIENSWNTEWYEKFKIYILN